MQEVLSRTSSRATINFALASKLAEKIGQQQAEIMALLQQNTSSSSGASQPNRTSTSTSSSGFYHYSGSQAGDSFSRSSSGASTASSTSSPPADTSSTHRASAPNSSSSSTPSSVTTTSSSGSGGYEAPWEKSLREARDRVAEVEAQATAAGQAASWKARETIEVRSPFTVEFVHALGSSAELALVNRRQRVDSLILSVSSAVAVPLCFTVLPLQHSLLRTPCSTNTGGS